MAEEQISARLQAQRIDRDEINPGTARKLIEAFEQQKEGGVSRGKGGRKNVLIVFAHQDHRSFNGALLETAITTLEQEGHKVTVSDLYEMEFKAGTDKDDIIDYEENGDLFKYPVATGNAIKDGKLAEDIMSELKKLDAADLVIFQFPLYWFSFPAVMKGWIDRVFVFNYVYGGEMGFYDKARYKGKQAVLSFTTGGPPNMYSSRGLNGDMEVFLWHMQNSLRFVNASVLKPQINYSVSHVDDAARAEMLEDWGKRLKNIFYEKPLKFLPMDKFSDSMQLPEEDAKQAATIGQHAGKPIPEGTMTRP